jgi:predicted nucleic acid-binding protein
MKGNALIDTNIWVYAITKNDLEKHQIAQKLIRELKPNRRILSSPQIVNEISFTLMRNGIPDTEIRELMEALYADLRVINFTPQIVRQASKIREKYKYKFWDSLIIATALSSYCLILYSDQLPHNAVIEDRLRILNPFK